MQIFKEFILTTKRHLVMIFFFEVVLFHRRKWKREGFRIILIYNDELDKIKTYYSSPYVNYVATFLQFSFFLQLASFLIVSTKLFSQDTF